jgi:hypothetical protein
MFLLDPLEAALEEAVRRVSGDPDDKARESS